LAVLRANSIGDYLVSLPALQALRAAYPAAELVLLGADWQVGAVRGAAIESTG
jgi:ADP-heptose:LPS heptosyltransferase